MDSWRTLLHVARHDSIAFLMLLSLGSKFLLSSRTTTTIRMSEVSLSTCYVIRSTPSEFPSVSQQQICHRLQSVSGKWRNIDHPGLLCVDDQLFSSVSVRPSQKTPFIKTNHGDMFYVYYVFM